MIAVLEICFRTYLFLFGRLTSHVDGPRFQIHERRVRSRVVFEREDKVSLKCDVLPIEGERICKFRRSSSTEPALETVNMINKRWELTRVRTEPGLERIVEFFCIRICCSFSCFGNKNFFLSRIQHLSRRECSEFIRNTRILIKDSKIKLLEQSRT